MSGKGAVRLQYGGICVVAALAVHVFGVAVDAVAALHLGDGGSCVGSRAQGIGVVSYAAAKLDVILVPVPPQNSLDLAQEIIYQILANRSA